MRKNQNLNKKNINLSRIGLIDLLRKLTLSMRNKFKDMKTKPKLLNIKRNLDRIMQTLLTFLKITGKRYNKIRICLYLVTNIIRVGGFSLKIKKRTAYFLQFHNLITNLSHMMIQTKMIKVSNFKMGINL